jgi:hypothetical protein
MTATVVTRSNTGGVANKVILNITTDGGAAADTSFNIGFVPRYVLWANRTNFAQLEFFEGMAVGTSLRTVAAGTRTLDVAPAGITLGVPAQGTGGQVTIKAADIPASSSFSLVADG